MITEEEYNKIWDEIENDYYEVEENQRLQNAFKVLGIHEDANISEIKKAFRAMAKKHHPDVNKSPEAETKFKEVNEAYKLIKENLNFN